MALREEEGDVAAPGRFLLLRQAEVQNLVIVSYKLLELSMGFCGRRIPDWIYSIFPVNRGIALPVAHSVPLRVRRAHLRYL